MISVYWLVAFLVALGLAYWLVPGDETLRLYIGIFFTGGALRGILDTLWSKKND